MFFKSIFIDLGIDLGTANTIVYAKNRGILVNEPSYIAFDRKHRLIALGEEAKKMWGRTSSSSIDIKRPMVDGVVADFIAGDAMIRGFIRSAKISKIRIGKVVMGVPTGATSVEKRSMIASAKAAGARRVYLISEPIAAAIGLGLDIKGRKANMVVDIGGGTTDIAVVNYGGIVVDNTIRVAGDELDKAIKNYLRKEYNIRIGDIAAEKLKIKRATISDSYKGKKFSIRTLDHISGGVRIFELPAIWFKDALKDVIQAILTAILHVLESLPVELASDIIDRGMILTGGGALLTGLSTLIKNKTNLPIIVPDDPLMSVAKGISEVIKDLKNYQDVLISSSYSE